MTSYVLRVYGLASDDELDLAGPPRYLAGFDVDYRPDLPAGLVAGLTGVADLTHYLAEAIRFPTSKAAFLAWQTRSTVMPTRPDGRPNRPLTAYTMSIEEVP